MIFADDKIFLKVFQYDKILFAVFNTCTWEKEEEIGKAYALALSVHQLLNKVRESLTDRISVNIFHP